MKKTFVEKFARKMSKRANQYMIRSVYDLLPKESKRKKKNE